MRKQKEKGLTVLCMLILFCAVLTGCTKKEKESVQKVNGLEKLGAVTVVTREEGSGTREVFVEKTGVKGTNQEGKTVDETREDAVVKMDAESVLEEVAKNESAIGYVSVGSLKEEENGIKTVAIDGIEPTREQVGKGDYPLSRNLNIAYSGTLSPVEQDFMSYLLSKGQDIVGKGYVAVKKSSTFLSDQSQGSIRISGSTSVAPLMEELAKGYRSFNENVDITIEATDSTSGLTAAMQSACDWGMASRDLKEYEKELLEYKTIARDGVAVIVNENNPVDSLTLEQLKEIYSGEAQEWEDINP